MARRIYWETVKKWYRKHKKKTIGVFTAIFSYLFYLGLINVISTSGDIMCAGTLEDPCYIYIEFEANEDIFLYPIDSDPYNRNTAHIDFQPKIKEYKLDRS